MRNIASVCIGASLAASIAANPLALPRKSSIVLNRNDVNNDNDISDIAGLLSSVTDDLASLNPYLSLQATSIGTKVRSVDAAAATISNIFSRSPADLTVAVEELLSQGLIGQVLDLLGTFLNSSLNSVDNDNPKDPETSIYPSKSPGDAPYTLDENTLRSAIYIPESFSYGVGGKIPVILVPGTFIPAGVTYHFSFSKLGDYANLDPVWINIPGASLGDAQVNAEYVAYAINYISGISPSSTKVAAISWSQGGLDTQWALKYWPSTRSSLSDFVAISPDFHGTVLAYFVCPGFPFLTCTPSVTQQEYTSKFSATLRSNGGNSAYVPTTTLYSSFDEIVEPMSGTNSSSAYMWDERNVGVTNAWVQQVCANKIGGSFYTHEGMLYNPLSWALAIDAITHDGPGDISRLDLDKVCSTFLADGLDLEDLLGTEGLLLLALINLLTYGSWTGTEPSIMAYAQD
ncbi:hypothetical protein BGW36DRAFT_426023 [Talaromyces proteolyticus]|uniref:Lipase n=1 Tax=Talaromyces proteolyticus TaxID=1131652 RepID=A0AAD4KSA0_9EURO|nr:uncharacterized protein BGW36DRAFT_426023 [Talaromyces proteolyticus]KAH8698311.1 hypothetical protein BGW36DRAFT_426023 [Talaromyces proteolyticus]